MIRSGEAPVVGWSRQMLYSGFSILPRSVFRSANSIARSDNLDVIHLNMNLQFSIKTLICSTAVIAIALALELNFKLISRLLSVPMTGSVKLLFISGLFALIFFSPGLLRRLKFKLLAGSNYQCPICFGEISQSKNRCIKCGHRYRP